jgi:hypothetical protein
MPFGASVTLICSASAELIFACSSLSASDLSWASHHTLATALGQRVALFRHLGERAGSTPVPEEQLIFRDVTPALIHRTQH